jgi:adenylate kinase
MHPKTFIFMGRSGCGKGTQAKILIEHLEKMDPEHNKIVYLETGARFRNFIGLPGYSNKLAAQIQNAGGRQPDFLAVWNWAHVLLEEMTGKEHLVVDGMPRSYQEALVFDTAIHFYKRERPIVIHVDVSREWSKQHLLARASKEGRKDDADDSSIERRLDYFEKEVHPAIEFFKKNAGYRYIHVKGEHSVEEVSQDIMSKLSW